MISKLIKRFKYWKSERKVNKHRKAFSLVAQGLVDATLVPMDNLPEEWSDGKYGEVLEAANISNREKLENSKFFQYRKLKTLLVKNTEDYKTLAKQFAYHYEIQHNGKFIKFREFDKNISEQELIGCAKTYCEWYGRELNYVKEIIIPATENGPGIVNLVTK